MACLFYVLMVLTVDTKHRLLDFISASPRSVQEIAFEFDKNWRTIDGYVSKLEEEGLVKVKEFRKGARVAFKIVYMQPDITFNASHTQNKILRQLESGKRSQDFSPLNIIQQIPERHVRAYFRMNSLTKDKVTEDLFYFLKKTSTSLLMFSGDLSWIDLKVGNKSIIEILEHLAKQKVSIKIIARVDRNTKNKIEKLLHINYKVGYDWIEIHHEEQALRCFISDSKVARLKEPSFSSREGELKKVGTFFYETNEESWVNWLERVFWNMFRSSLPAQKRLEILKRIEELEIV